MIGEVIKFDSPLIAAVALSNSLLARAGYEEVGVSTRVPDPVEGSSDSYPDLFVTISRASTVRSTPAHQEAGLLFEVRGVDEGAVEDLADDLFAMLLAVDEELVGETWVSWVHEQSGVVDYADIERQLERFQFVVTMRTRGRNLILAEEVSP